jgi:parallel beta-helix repeat protein
MRSVTTVRTGSACLALACLLAIPARAQEYFVAPDGDDAGPGTVEKPWKSPVRAAAKLMPGDTLLFRSGEYKCRSTYPTGLCPARSGEEGRPITFKAYKDEHVRLDCSKGAEWGVTNNGWSWIVFEGFEIVNREGYAMKIGVNNNNSKQSGEHVTVRNCEFHHTSSEALFAISTPYLTIENCHTHDAERSHGLYISRGCDNLVVRNVTSENNRGNSGIQINAAGKGGAKDGLVERCILRGNAQGFSLMGVINCTFRNNVVYNNGFDGPRESGWREVIMWTYGAKKDGPPGTICEGNVFENNTFVNLVPEGHKLSHIVHSKSGTKNCTFRNNIFAVRNLPVFTLSSFEGFAFENNCLYRFGPGDEVSKQGSLADFCKAGGLKATGNISGDPMFVDAEKGDLHLKPGSPCLGAGAGGNGKAPDIGAWQSGGDFRIGCQLPWKHTLPEFGRK